MRLSGKEIETIKSVILGVDHSAKVHLFGSRTDDTKKGGDIDLLIFSEKLGFDEKLKIKAALNNFLGEQKIDIIIARDRSNPFVDLVYDSSLRLS